MTNVKMNAGKITAKLRDAVPVRFMVEGEEVAMYKNIDIPDSLKELEIQDFAFDVPADGKISFQLFFADGILPEELPEARAKMTRAEKAAVKEINTGELAEAAAEVIRAVTGSEVIVNIAPSVNTDKMEIAYNVTGSARKQLVTAVATLTGIKAEYKGVPSMAYTIGEYQINVDGTLTGEYNQELIDALADQGFVAA